MRNPFRDFNSSSEVKPVACQRNDLLTGLRHAAFAARTQVRTTKDRILFAIFIHENDSREASAAVSLTHNS